MTTVQRFRYAIAKHLGQVMTPEVAAAIEMEALTEPDRSIDCAALGAARYEGLEFHVERFGDVLPELHALHEQHWQETERFRHGIALRPNYDYLHAAEQRGNLLQLTARKDARLVGNIRMYLFEDLHTSTKCAKEDTFFLCPEVRQGLNAIRFWQFNERCLATLGVREVRTDSKILKDADGNVIRNVGRLNERLGYTHVANSYSKRLGNANEQ